MFGPFFVEGAPEVALGGDIANGAHGHAVLGAPARVTDTDGAPVAGARIDVWQADEDGFYDVQYADARRAGRPRPAAHRRRTAATGSGRCGPSAYPIPDDGPVGDLLTAAGRGPMRPAHLHFMVDGARLPDACHPHLRRRRPTTWTPTPCSASRRP